MRTAAGLRPPYKAKQSKGLKQSNLRTKQTKEKQSKAPSTGSKQSHMHRIHSRTRGLQLNYERSRERWNCKGLRLGGNERIKLRRNRCAGTGVRRNRRKNMRGEEATDGVMLSIQSCSKSILNNLRISRHVPSRAQPLIACANILQPRTGTGQEAHESTHNRARRHISDWLLEKAGISCKNARFCLFSGRHHSNTLRRGRVGRAGCRTLSLWYQWSIGE